MQNLFWVTLRRLFYHDKKMLGMMDGRYRKNSDAINYNDTTNKPTINNVVLSNDKTTSDLFDFDDAPIEDSDNLITSGGVYAGIQHKRYLTWAEYTALTEEEQEDESIAYMITDKGEIWIGDEIFGTADFTSLRNKPTINGVTISGNKTTADLGLEQIQYASIPLADVTNLGKIIQYIGETTAEYTNGYYYKCVSDEQDPPTYSWIENPTQEGTGITVDDALSTTSENPTQNKVVTTALNSKISTSSIGSANGVAGLDANGKVPTTQLPDSLELGETSTTAYRGDRGKIAYDDSQANKTNIGNLSNLITTAKTDLVSAINEAAQTGGSSDVSVLDDLEDVNLTTPSDGEVLKYNGTNWENAAEKQEIRNIRMAQFNQLTPSEQNNGQAYFIPDAFIRGGVPVDVEKIQVTTLPIASSEELNKIYQYIGNTTQDYTHGYFYECIEDDSVEPATYSWENVQVSEGGSGGTLDFDELNNRPTEASDIEDIITPLPSTVKKGIKYSTEEQVVGEWIDGKPIYQICIQGTTDTTGGNWSVFSNTTIPNFDKLIDIRLIPLSNDTYGQGIPYMHMSLFVRKTNNVGTIYNAMTNSAWGGKQTYVTVQYTKTTD